MEDLRWVTWSTPIALAASMMASFVIFSAGWADTTEALALALALLGLPWSLTAIGFVVPDDVSEITPPQDTADGFTDEIHHPSRALPRLLWVCGVVGVGVSLSLPGLLAQPVLRQQEAVGVFAFTWMGVGLALGLAWWPLAHGARSRIRLQGRVFTAGRRSVVIHAPQAQLHLQEGVLRIHGGGERIVLRGPPAQLQDIAERLWRLSTLPGDQDEVPDAIRELGRQAARRSGAQPAGSDSLSSGGRR